MKKGISARRIKNDLNNINIFAREKTGGITRFSFSPEHEMAVRYLATAGQSFGGKSFLDRIGNWICRKEGMEPHLPALALGSHIDSVKNGGAFDGIAGVVVGLEVFRIMHEEKVQLRHPLQLFGFVEEEGVLFHSALIGSRFFSGELSERNLRELLTPEGLSCAEMAQHFCTNLNPIMEGVLPQEAYDLAFFLEPHIEQGPVLERENISLGVVTSITGTTMTEITFFGEANHAGTTPMDIRKDPVRGMIHLGNRLEEKLSQVPRVVGTIGRILVDPNVGNVIPSQVCFTVDIRCVEKKTLQKLLEGLKIWGQEAAEKFRLKVEFLQGHQVMPLQMDAKLQEELGRQAAKLHMPSMGLHSGAGHDALSMARICPVGMVFVPSKNGKSHCPEESSDFEHLGQVARMLWEVIQQQDRIL